MSHIRNVGEGTGTEALRGQRPAYCSSQRKGFLLSCYIFEGDLAETPLLDPFRQWAGYSWFHLKDFETNGQNMNFLLGKRGLTDFHVATCVPKEPLLSPCSWLGVSQKQFPAESWSRRVPCRAIQVTQSSTSHGGTVNWEADAQLPPVYFHTQWYLSETEGPSLNRLTRNLFPVFFWYRISFCRCLYGTKAIKTKTLLCHLYAQQRRLTVLPWQPKSTRSLLTSHNEVCVWEEVFCLHQGPGMSRVKQVKYSIGVNSDRAIHCAKETDRQTFVKMPSWRSSCCSCMHTGTFWNSGGSCRKLAEYRATARKHLWKEMAGSFPSHMETNTAEKRAEIEPYLKTDSKSTTCLPWRDTMGKVNSEYLPPTEI